VREEGQGGAEAGAMEKGRGRRRVMVAALAVVLFGALAYVIRVASTRGRWGGRLFPVATVPEESVVNGVTMHVPWGNTWFGVLAWDIADGQLSATVQSRMPLARGVRFPAHVFAGPREHVFVWSAEREVGRGEILHLEWDVSEAGEDVEDVILTNPLLYSREAAGRLCPVTITMETGEEFVEVVREEVGIRAFEVELRFKKDAPAGTRVQARLLSDLTGDQVSVTQRLEDDYAAGSTLVLGGWFELALPWPGQPMFYGLQVSVTPARKGDGS